MTKLKVNEEVYVDELQMAEAMNKSFQAVFTKVSVFDETPGSGIRCPCLNNVELTELCSK